MESKNLNTTNDNSASIVRIDAGEALHPLIEYIVVGLDDNLKQQLINKSKQQHIAESTPSDIRERFGDQAMLNKWLEKGRTIHCMIGPSNDLAGVIWYGKATPPIDTELPKLPKNTFAIRIYDGYVGKGLAKPFMRQSLQILVKSELEKGNKIDGVWLKTKVGNEPAKAVYTKFGYEETYRDDKFIVMVLSPEDISRIIRE